MVTLCWARQTRSCWDKSACSEHHLDSVEFPTTEQAGSLCFVWREDFLDSFGMARSRSEEQSLASIRTAWMGRKKKDDAGNRGMKRAKRK